LYQTGHLPDAGGRATQDEGAHRRAQVQTRRLLRRARDAADRRAAQRRHGDAERVAGGTAGRDQRSAAVGGVYGGAIHMFIYMHMRIYVYIYPSKCLHIYIYLFVAGWAAGRH